MKVRDLLETKGKDTVSIDVSSSVDDAIRSMHARKISAIMVMENGKTCRDLHGAGRRADLHRISRKKL